MTLQKLYSRGCLITPPLETINDDTKFDFLFDIPSDQLILNIDISEVSIEVPITVVPANNSSSSTTNLTGKLKLDRTEMSVTHISNPETTIYYAGVSNNAIVFEYDPIEYDPSPVITKKFLQIGDIVNNKIITKVVNRINHLCYAEFESLPIATTSVPIDPTSNLPISTNPNSTLFVVATDYRFIKDVRYVSKKENIEIIVRSGKDIAERFGIIGKFSTNYKEISYYAKFKTPYAINSNKVNFDNYPIDRNLNTIDTPTSVGTASPLENRWQQINDTIINPAQTNQSEIASINNTPAFTNFTSNLDGTSDPNHPYKTNSFFDIPIKNSEVSYGICNYRVLNDRRDLLGPIDLPITIEFKRYYTPVEDLYSNIDGWLTHTWIGDTEPTIAYERYLDGSVKEVSIFSSASGTYSKLVLFGASEQLMYNGVHNLDYNTEPYGSSNVTQFFDIQGTYVIPCTYRFSIDRIAEVNSIGGNIEYPDAPETKLAATFNSSDSVISVGDTSDFTDSGYLSIPIYSITSKSTARTNTEFRQYNYIDRLIVSYSGKTPKSFTGVKKISGASAVITKLTSNEFPDLYPTINQH